MGCERAESVSFSWTALYLLAVLAVLAVTFVLYGSMPERIPVHYGPHGIDGWIDKGPRALAFPAALSAFLSITFFGIDLLERRAATYALKGARAEDKPLLARYRHAQSICVLLGGSLLSLSMGMSMALSFANVIPLESVVVLAVVVSVGLVVAMLYPELKYGFRPACSGSDTNPGGWKGAVIYSDAADSRLFVPRRDTLGWTLNFGHRRAWPVLALSMLGPLAFIAALMLLAS